MEQQQQQHSAGGAALGLLPQVQPESGQQQQQQQQQQRQQEQQAPPPLLQPGVTHVPAAERNAVRDAVLAVLRLRTNGIVDHTFRRVAEELKQNAALRAEVTAMLRREGLLDEGKAYSKREADAAAACFVRKHDSAHAPALRARLGALSSTRRCCRPQRPADREARRPGASRSRAARRTRRASRQRGGMEDSDVSLPRATLTKMVKEVLPPDMRCAADCMDMLMDCCTEFIQLLSSEANDLATSESKSTITPEHVVRALGQLGFEDWAADVRRHHEQFKADAKQAPKLANRKTKAELEGMTEDEQLELQRRLFAEARARSMNVDAMAEASVAAAYGSGALSAQPSFDAGAAGGMPPPAPPGRAGMEQHTAAGAAPGQQPPQRGDDEQAPALRVLEFFCGIGGLHAAVRAALPGAAVVEAFDVSPPAREVYALNFGRAPCKLDLEVITPAQLDSYGADLWCLSPPCQPHTRQGLRQGSADARSRALHNLLDALPAMAAPPRWVLLENVVGFESSDTHAHLAAVLRGLGMHLQSFVLSPSQYGLPYTRPRFFTLASRAPFAVELPPHAQPCQCTPALLLQLRDAGAGAGAIADAAARHLGTHVPRVQTVGECLWGWRPDQRQQDGQAAPPDGEHARHVFVPPAHLAKHAGVLRVATAASCNLNCFTKSYGAYARGTGALLASVDPVGADPRWRHQRLACGRGCLIFTPSWAAGGGRDDGNGGGRDDGGSGGSGDSGSGGGSGDSGSGGGSGGGDSGSEGGCDGADCGAATGGGPGAAAPVVMVRPGEPFIPVAERQDTSDAVLAELGPAWAGLGVRHFTPLEIARLHSFPPGFAFPPGMPRRAAYALLGNSLSVAVVADLLSYLVHG
ncbi:DNMT2 [Scenedesmus sp. PABB004]|nr:DNMT2 [Scenedesmus sp. PABB004]